MNAQKSVWAIALLAAAVGVLATLLVVRQGGVGAPMAYGQVSEGVGAGYVVGILGEKNNNQLPLFMVDTKSQTILIYEFDLSQRQLYLRVARSFTADRDLVDNSWGKTNQYAGPSVKDVQNILRGGR